MKRDAAVCDVAVVAPHGGQGRFSRIDDSSPGDLAVRFGRQHPGGGRGFDPAVERFAPTFLRRQLSEADDEPFLARQMNIAALERLFPIEECLERRRGISAGRPGRVAALISTRNSMIKIRSRKATG